jgi:hypothetical protein
MLKNIAWSLLASSLLAVLVLILFYPAQGVPGNLFVVTVLVHLLFLLLGCLTFVLRLFRLAPLPEKLDRFLDPVNNPARFFYIFMGIGNLILGVLPFVLHYLGTVNTGMITEFWPHLPLAAVLLVDSFVIGTAKGKLFS